MSTPLITTLPQFIQLQRRTVPNAFQFIHPSENNASRRHVICQLRFVPNYGVFFPLLKTQFEIHSAPSLCPKCEQILRVLNTKHRCEVPPENVSVDYYLHLNRSHPESLCICYRGDWCSTRAKRAFLNRVERVFSFRFVVVVDIIDTDPKDLVVNCWTILSEKKLGTESAHGKTNDDPEPADRSTVHHVVGGNLNLIFSLKGA